MKTTAMNENKKEVKKAPVKTTSSAKDSVTDKAIAAKTPQKEKSAIKNTGAIKPSTRRKRLVNKITEIRHEIVQYEHSGTLLNSFIILVGFFMIFQGILGLQNPIVLNIFTTNTTHAIIHLVLGLTAVGFGYKQNTFGFSLFIGVLLVTVGVLRFIPATSDLVVSLLNANEAVAVLNIAIGALALLLSFTDTKSYETVYQ